MQLKEILEIQSKQNLIFKLIIDKNEFDVVSLKIKHENTPVTKPTKRGGVYFSDKIVCKISAIINDLKINEYLTKAMLGPNTEFQNIILQTTYQKNNQKININMITNLTSSMQSSNKIELNLILQDIITK